MTVQFIQKKSSRSASLMIVSPRSLQSQRGLTLIEIIIVLVILASLMFFLTGSLFSKAEAAKVQVTMMKLDRLKNAIGQYQLMHNSLPQNLDALVNCTSQTSGKACIPVADAEDLKDAWERPVVYSLDGSGRSFKVKSLGADKKEGGSGVDSDVFVEGP